MALTETFQQSVQYRAAARICEELRRAGHAAYFAGGCVRDLLMAHRPSDYDVATSALPGQVLQLFERTQAVGAHFGVILVQLELDDELVQTEIATFRNDGAYSDGRRPDSVSYTSDPREDVQRRDFTINGMLLDPGVFARDRSVDSAVLDFVDGKLDLAAGIVRAIGPASLRFQEDKLRMLRGVRFAARFDFELAPETSQAMRTLAPQIHQVSPERVRDELTRMLTEGHASRALELLDSTGLLQQVLPEIARMKGVEQPLEFHPEGDVWVHTLLLLAQLPENCSPTLAWGALLHDVGKPPTFERAPDRIRFNGHAEIGTRMAEAICKRLRFSLAETQQIIELVANHMRFGDVQQMKESTLKRFFRLPNFEQHLELHRMDCAASHGNLGLYEFACERFHAMPAEVARPRLFVTGDDLIRAGYKPGPRFTEMLAAAEDAQLEGRTASTGEGMALIEAIFGAATAQPS